MKMEQKLKRRFADGRANTSILKSKCKNMYINNKEFVGNISLLQIEEVKEEWRVDQEERCILAKGYYWLEIYPENKNCCITAIFNNNKEVWCIYDSKGDLLKKGSKNSPSDLGKEKFEKLLKDYCFEKE